MLSNYERHKNNCDDCKTDIPLRPMNLMNPPTNGMHLFDFNIVIAPTLIRKITAFAKQNDLLLHPSTKKLDIYHGSATHDREEQLMQERNDAKNKKKITAVMTVASVTAVITAGFFCYKTMFGGTTSTNAALNQTFFDALYDNKMIVCKI